MVEQPPENLVKKKKKKIAKMPQTAWQLQFLE